jgi:hypothetical protein
MPLPERRHRLLGLLSPAALVENFFPGGGPLMGRRRRSCTTRCEREGAGVKGIGRTAGAFACVKADDEYAMTLLTTRESRTSGAVQEMHI